MVSTKDGDDKASIHSASSTYTTRTIAGTEYTSLSARILTLALHKEESDTVSESGTIRTEIGHHDYHNPACETRKHALKE